MRWPRHRPPAEMVFASLPLKCDNAVLRVQPVVQSYRTLRHVGGVNIVVRISSYCAITLQASGGACAYRSGDLGCFVMPSVTIRPRRSLSPSGHVHHQTTPSRDLSLHHCPARPGRMMFPIGPRSSSQGGLASGGLSKETSLHADELRGGGEIGLGIVSGFEPSLDGDKLRRGGTRRIEPANTAYPQSPASLPERLRCGVNPGGVGTMNRCSTLITSVRGGVGHASRWRGTVAFSVCNLGSARLAHTLYIA